MQLWDTSVYPCFFFKSLLIIEVPTLKSYLDDCPLCSGVGWNGTVMRSQVLKTNHSSRFWHEPTFIDRNFTNMGHLRLKDQNQPLRGQYDEKCPGYYVTAYCLSHSANLRHG